MGKFLQKFIFALVAVLLVVLCWQLISSFRERPIRIVSRFEGSPQMKVKKVSNTHWLLDIEDKTWRRPHFFFFRVEGASGRTVTFEIPNAPPKWAGLNPVYCYESKIDDLDTFFSPPAAVTHSKLPNTSGQYWHFIEDAKLTATGAKLNFCFRHKFDRDAYVCMRYPYTPSYNERYLTSLVNNPVVRVVTVGKSKEGRPLQVVEIGQSGVAHKREKPSVLIYAREHADEQDSSWVAQGVIECLLSDTVQARELREEFTLLVIPMLDPDGAARGVYQNITESFVAGKESQEAAAYGAYFKQWADTGNKLEFILSLHNLEAQEGPHISLLIVEPDQIYQRYSTTFFDRCLFPSAQTEGFRADSKNSRPVPGRLRTLLGNNLGALVVSIEVNSQDPVEHLTLSDLRSVGKVLVLAVGKFLSLDEGHSLAARVDAIRWDRSGIEKGDTRIHDR
jgi:hypothetical protein